MRFHFHPAADAEFDRAVEYYERCQSGLGLEFAEEVYAAIARTIGWRAMSSSAPVAITRASSLALRHECHCLGDAPTHIERRPV